MAELPLVKSTKGPFMYKPLIGKKVYILTLGCKVNQYESDAMLETLLKNGCVRCDPDAEASSENEHPFPDICIVNTCSVTNIADRKSRQMLHKMKRNNPDAIVVAAGCYVQEAGEKLLQDDAVDMIVGNNRKRDIARLIAEYLEKNVTTDNLIDINNTSEFESISIEAPESHTRAYLKIEDGCNYFCSYCIIPYVRGRVRIKPFNEIIDEAAKLAENGIKEIVLTGINLSCYNDNGRDLADVSLAIAEIPDIARVRISSLEPRIITEDFMDRISSSEKICPHFHLSLQSACNNTLKRMNRHYTIEEYEKACELIRRYYDRPAITTDVIVGFPGETDDDFNNCYENLKRINLYEMHIFKYSRRQGTVADKLPDQIPENVKSERSDILLSLTASNKAEYEKSFIGENVNVLIEEIIEKADGLYFRGHTERYLLCDIPIRNIVDDESDFATYINKIVSVQFRF